MRSRRSVWFWLQLALTLAVCAFLIVPIGLSMLAGVTQNYFLKTKYHTSDTPNINYITTFFLKKFYLINCRII
jgi:hypothetical protein